MTCYSTEKELYVGLQHRSREKVQNMRLMSTIIIIRFEDCSTNGAEVGREV